MAIARVPTSQHGFPASSANATLSIQYHQSRSPGGQNRNPGRVVESLRKHENRIGDSEKVIDWCGMQQLHETQLRVFWELAEELLAVFRRMAG